MSNRFTFLTVPMVCQVLQTADRVCYSDTMMNGQAMNTPQSVGSDGPEGRKALISPAKMKVVVGVVIVAVLAMLLFLIYDRFNQKENDSGHEDWEIDLLAVLREYEVEWDDERIEKWDTLKTLPLETALIYALRDDPRYVSGKAVLYVGDETIYTDDINFYLYFYHNPEYTLGKEFTDRVLIEVAEQVVRDSVIIQAGVNEDLITEPENMMDQPFKDHMERLTLAQTVKETLPVGSVDVEVVTAWFFNSVEPEMGVDVASEYARELLSSLHERVSGGDITMQDAGEALRQDAVMQVIDGGLEGNSYQHFVINLGEQRYFDASVQDTIFSLQEGEISDVKLGQDLNASDQWYDAFYYFAYMRERSAGVISFDEWVGNHMDEFSIYVVDE